MIELKPDEIRLWEQVYASCHSGRRGMDGVTASRHADRAIKDRRERFQPKPLPSTPYRDYND